MQAEPAPAELVLRGTFEQDQAELNRRSRLDAFARDPGKFEFLGGGRHCSFDILHAVRELSDLLPVESREILEVYARQIRQNAADHGLDPDRFKLMCVVGNLDYYDPASALKKLADFLLHTSDTMTANFCSPGLNSDYRVFTEGNPPWIARAARANDPDAEQIGFLLSTPGYENAPFSSKETKASPERYASLLSDIVQSTVYQEHVILTGHSMGCRVSIQALAKIVEHLLKDQLAPDLVLLQPAVSLKGRLRNDARGVFTFLKTAVGVGDTANQTLDTDLIHNVVTKINHLLVKMLTRTGEDLSQQENELLNKLQAQLAQNGIKDPKVAIEYCQALAAGLSPELLVRIPLLIAISEQDKIVSPADIRRFFEVALSRLSARYEHHGVQIENAVWESRVGKLTRAGHMVNFSEKGSASAVEYRLKCLNEKKSILTQARQAGLTEIIQTCLKLHIPMKVVDSDTDKAIVLISEAKQHLLRLVSDSAMRITQMTDKQVVSASKLFREVTHLKSLIAAYPYTALSNGHLDGPDGPNGLHVQEILSRCDALPAVPREKLSDQLTELQELVGLFLRMTYDGMDPRAEVQIPGQALALVEECISHLSHVSEPKDITRNPGVAKALARSK